MPSQPAGSASNTLPDVKYGTPARRAQTIRSYQRSNGTLYQYIRSTLEDRLPRNLALGLLRRGMKDGGYTVPVVFALGCSITRQLVPKDPCGLGIHLAQALLVNQHKAYRLAEQDLARIAPKTSILPPLPAGAPTSTFENAPVAPVAGIFEASESQQVKEIDRLDQVYRDLIDIMTSWLGKPYEMTLRANIPALRPVFRTFTTLTHNFFGCTTAMWSSTEFVRDVFGYTNEDWYLSDYLKDNPLPAPNDELENRTQIQLLHHLRDLKGLWQQSFEREEPDRVQGEGGVYLDPKTILKTPERPRPLTI